MDSLINKIEYILISKNIQIDDSELFHYGLKKLLSNILIFTLVILISMFFHIMIPSLLFLVTLLFLRSKTGGFHFETAQICFTFSILLPIMTVILFDKIDSSRLLVLLICIVCSLLTILFSPINHPNKGLDDNDIKFFKKKTVTSIIILYCVILLLELISRHDFSRYIQLGIIVNFISMAFALIKNNVKIDKGGVKS